MEAQIFIIEHFTDDYTLNVTKEGYTFLTVKQAVEFLRHIDQDQIGTQEGYLLKMIDERKKIIADKLIK